MKRAAVMAACQPSWPLARSADIRWLAAWRFRRLKPIPVAGSSRLLSVTRCCSLTLLAFNNQQRQSNKRVTSPSYVNRGSAAHFSAASRSSQSSSPANRLLARLRLTLRVTLRYGSSKALYGYVTLRVPYLGYRNRNRTFGNHTENQKQLLRTAPAIHALVDQPLGLQR